MVGCWLVRRGQWPAVMLAALSVRLLLDPATHHYYSAGLLFAALAFDVLVARARVPVMTIAMAIGTVLPWFHVVGMSASMQGAVRAIATLGALAAVCWHASSARGSVLAGARPLQGHQLLTDTAR